MNEEGDSEPRQKRMDVSEQEKANTGLVWRKLGGDVTRAPIRGNLFAVAMGTGAQVTACWYTLLFFYLTNMLAHLMVRPWLYYSTVFILASSGFVNGFVMGRVLRIFGREDGWQPVASVSALLFPCFVAGCLFAIDFFEWSQAAGEEFDFLRAFSTLIIWTIVGLPTTFCGAARAMTKEVNNSFKNRNTNPRLIPEQPAYMSLGFVSTVSGAVIFSSFFVVLKYMWKSIWRSEAYAMIGYLVLYTLLLTIVISLLSVIWTFLGLRNGNYVWQWRSWCVGASSGLYVTAFTVYYMLVHLNLLYVADDFIYLLWTALFLVSYTLLAGATSAFASTVFIAMIYNKEM